MEALRLVCGSFIEKEADSYFNSSMDILYKCSRDKSPNEKTIVEIICKFESKNNFALFCMN